jgi:hypothetical protein
VLDWFKDNANATAIQAFAACIQLAFAFALVFIGGAQLWTYHKQRRVMEETRDIVLAGLGRPHVFFEFLHHNFDEWREGRADYLFFCYKFTNYGTSPGIIRHIFARAILSRGPRGGADEETTIIEEFPKPDQLSDFLAWVTAVRVAERTETGWESGRDWTGNTFVISPHQSSEVFTTNVRRSGRDTPFRDYLQEQAGPNGWVRPWLIGRVIYSDTLERMHHTSFCICAGREREYTAYGQPPYDERI